MAQRLWMVQRLWVPLVAAVVVVLAVVLVVGVGRAGARSSHGPAPRTVAVLPGDTLWSIARVEQPRGDVRPLIATISRLNKVGGTLSPGATLVLP